MKRFTPRLLTLLSIALLGTTSQAAVSNITLTNNGFVSPLLPGYSLYEALNFQGPPTLNRNGINFVGENMTDGVGGLGTTLITLGTGGVLSTADIGSATDALFFTETWNQGGTGLRMTISGLNPSLTYFFETYHGEPRSCCNGTFSADKFIDASGTTPIPTYTLGNGIVDSSPGDRWTISATISGVSSFQYETPNGAGRGASIMGYQIQAVPEPSSAALLLAGGALALRRRRK